MKERSGHQEINIPVRFEGVVTVRVPCNLAPDLAKILAEKLGFAKVLVTIENPDSGDSEMDGCDELAEAFGLSEEQAGALWDSAEAIAASGEWMLVEGDEEPDSGPIQLPLL